MAAFRYESLMQLSVWLIRDCIPNRLSNTFFFKTAHTARDLLTIPSIACLVLLSLKIQQPEVASKAHGEFKGPLLLTVVEKHFVQRPNQCVCQNMEVVHLQVLMWWLDCLQPLLCQCLCLCVVFLWICLLWTLLEELGSAILSFFRKSYPDIVR